MRGQVADSLRALEASPGHVLARFAFDPGLPVFRGHFPARPLVPGVFLVEGARLVGERAVGRPLRVAGVRRAKFTGEVGPDALVELRLSLRGEGPWEGTAEWSRGEEPVARLRLALEEVRG